MPVVVATITPLPEAREEVRAALLDAVPGVHAEDGCELYALHEDDQGFVFVEQWTSQAALDDHAAGAVLQQLGPRLDGRLARETDVRILTALAAGDPDKGKVVP